MAGAQGQAGIDHTAGPNGWRYRFANGQWWYWLPDNRWAVYLDGRWIGYSPELFANRSTNAGMFSQQPAYGNYGNLSPVLGPIDANAVPNMHGDANTGVQGDTNPGTTAGRTPTGSSGTGRF